MSTGFEKTGFRAFLDRPLTLADGAMGTLLIDRGFAPPLEPLNFTEPDAVRAIHASYAAAGSRILLTNSFGVLALRLATPGPAENLIPQSVRLAREAIGAVGVVVAGCIGALGPAFQAESQGFQGRYAAALGQVVTDFAQAGVTDLVYETCIRGDELKAALDVCARHAGTNFILSVSPTADGSLPDGTSLAHWIGMLENSPAVAIGLNCGYGPGGFKPFWDELLRLSSKPLWLKPAVGLPRQVNGRWVYPLSPEAFAREVRELVNDRVRFLGGCCGTTPEHITALAK